MTFEISLTEMFLLTYCKVLLQCSNLAVYMSMSSGFALFFHSRSLHCSIPQMSVLLHSPKTSNDVTSLMKSCDSLNSAQLRALLCNYYPAPGEQTLSSELVGHLVMNAASTIDAQLQEEGRDVSVEEPADLNLPFLVPEDGYSCEFVRGMPAGLTEFVDQFVQVGECCEYSVI